MMAEFHLAASGFSVLRMLAHCQAVMADKTEPSLVLLVTPVLFLPRRDEFYFRLPSFVKSKNVITS